MVGTATILLENMILILGFRPININNVHNKIGDLKSKEK